MKPINIRLFIAVLLFSLCFWTVIGCIHAKSFQKSSDEKRNAATDEIYQGACAFSIKDYAEAQRRFEKAFALNPQDSRLPLYIARSIHGQAIKGTTAVNDVEKAKAAIAAYEKVLARSADNQEAVNAILSLYKRMNQEEQSRQWLQEHANSNSLPNSQRANLFTLLAENFYFSYNKIIHSTGSPMKPADSSDMERSRKYIQQGLDAIEQALQLNPDNSNTCYFKYLLLQAKAEIAGLEKKNDEQALYKKAADEAKAKYESLEQRARETTASVSPVNKEDKTSEVLESIENFRKSGVFKRYGDPEALLNPVEDPATLVSPEPSDLEQEHKKIEEERAARRMVKLPWELFSPVGKGFSVLMPSPVDESGRNLGNYSVMAEGISYFIHLHPLNKPASVQINNDMVISTEALGAAQPICGFAARGGQNCEVTFVKDLSLPANAGRQYAVKMANCSKIETGVLRVYLSQKNAYILWVMGADESDPKVTKFLQSFTLSPATKVK